MSLNYLAQISKSAYVAMLGTQENFKETYTIETINEEACESSGCPFFKIKQQLLDDTNELSHDPNMLDKIIDDCCRKCPTAYSCKKTTVYHNEKNKYQTDKLFKNGTIRFSKSQIKQYLLYHFLVKNNSGIISHLREADIAKVLGCSLRTVRNNNEFLCENLYISVCHTLIPGQITILLRGYKDRALSAEKGGRGYLVMTKESFENLLEIDDVNELRAQLRLLLNADDYKASEKKTSIPTSLKYIRRKLPKYITPKKIIELVSEPKNDSLFDIHYFKSNELRFKLKESFDPAIKKQELTHIFHNNFKAYFEELNYKVEEKDYDDLVQMSFQYNYETVLWTLKYISSKLIDGTIKNIGGYIRDVIIANTVKYNKDFWEQLAAEKEGNALESENLSV